MFSGIAKSVLGAIGIGDLAAPLLNYFSGLARSASPGMTLVLGFSFDGEKGQGPSFWQISRSPGLAEFGASYTWRASQFYTVSEIPDAVAGAAVDIMEDQVQLLFAAADSAAGFVRELKTSEQTLEDSF